MYSVLSRVDDRSGEVLLFHGLRTCSRTIPLFLAGQQSFAVVFPLPAPLALQRSASPSRLYRHPRVPYENSWHGVGSYMRSSWQSDKASRQSVLEHEDLTRPPMLSKRFLASAHIQLHHCQPCGLSSDISGRYSARRVLRRPPGLHPVLARQGYTLQNSLRIRMKRYPVSRKTSAYSLITGAFKSMTIRKIKI